MTQPTRHASFCSQLIAILAVDDEAKLYRLMQQVAERIDPEPHSPVWATLRNRLQLWPGFNERQRLITAAMFGEACARADMQEAKVAEMTAA